MICDNCGEVFEDFENEITCPVCGVLQNITQTQTDFFSGYYAQSKRAGRLSQPTDGLDLVADSEVLKRDKTIAERLDIKLSKQKIENLKQKELCIIVGLQEILMNLCKILVIKYEIIHLIESHCRYLWKLYLIHYFKSSNIENDAPNVDTDDVSTDEADLVDRKANREMIQTMKRISKLEREGINMVVVIILMSLNKYNYGMVCSDIYRLILLGRIPLRSVNRLLSRQVISKLHKSFIYLGPKGKLSKSLQEDYCTNLFTNSHHPKSVDALKSALHYFMTNILPILHSRRPGGSNIDELKLKYELNLHVFCRRIVNHARLPNVVLIVVDRLIKYLNHCDKADFNPAPNISRGESRELDSHIYGSLLGFPKNVISCAIILIACRLLWPIFHTQPPEHPNRRTNSHTTNSAHTSSSADADHTGEAAPKRKTKAKIKLLNQNERKIFWDCRRNTWSIKRDGEGDPTIGDSNDSDHADKDISHTRSRNTYDSVANPNQLSYIGSINRYGYLKAYLNVLYHYYRDLKGKVDYKQLVDSLKRELKTESDLDKFKRFILVSYKNTNFSSFLSSIILRYTTNHFLLFKLLSIYNKPNAKPGLTNQQDSDEDINAYLNLIGSSSNNLYKHLIDLCDIKSVKDSNASSEQNPSGKRAHPDKADRLFNLLRENIVGNCEIYYLITSLFKNYPFYSGFSLEKCLEFNHFVLTTNDQKRQIMNMVREIKLVNIYQEYTNVYSNITSKLLNYASAKNINKQSANVANKRRKYSKNAGGSVGVNSDSNNAVDDDSATSNGTNHDTVASSRRTCNLYEHELKRLENKFQEMGKITEVGYTLPPKPFNLKNKSYQGLPVVYLLLLKSVCNFAGVAHYRVHQCLAELENALISNVNSYLCTCVEKCVCAGKFEITLNVAAAG